MFNLFDLQPLPIPSSKIFYMEGSIFDHDYVKINDCGSVGDYDILDNLYFDHDVSKLSLPKQVNAKTT
jgi:hypothetical protein